MTRTDQHRLAELDPTDYRLLAYEVLEAKVDGSSDFEWIEDCFHDLDTRDDTTDEAYVELGRALVGERYKCSLCGGRSSHVWGYFEHVPTGEVVNVGHICAGKFKLETRADVVELLKARAEGRKLAALRGTILNGDPAAKRAVDICVAELVRIEERLAGERPDDDEAADHFLLDVARRFYREPFALSQKQVRAILKVPAARAARLERQAKWDAERANDEPVPDTDERIQITGEVIKIATQENDYGVREVMTVRDDRGFAVWGTQPSDLYGAEKGDRVTFVARVERSPDSETFGFFKRPTKAEILGAADDGDEAEEHNGEALFA